MSPVSDELRLRPLRMEDEVAARAAHRALVDYDFLLGWQEGRMSWEQYLDRLEDERCGVNLPASRVPSTLLVAVIHDEIVGRASIRHQLNEFLAAVGGHIGYAVVGQHRRRGYATEILRQSLIVARSLGVGRVLVTCDQDNEASRRVIERCGGSFEGLGPPQQGRPRKRRYWFD